jgi:hypothetical protein
MIGQTISHYKILEKPPTSSGQVGEGGMSPARTTEKELCIVRSGGENHPRTFSVSGCDFQDPRLTLQIRKGGQAPSFALFASAVFVADWRRREL